MNRERYVFQLKNALQGLPIEDLEDILSDYEEHFDIGLSEGKSEEEISRELGEPKEVANSYRTTYKASANARGFERSNNFGDDNTRKLLVALLLIAFNLIIVLGPFLGVLGLLLGVYGLSIGFVIGGFVSLFGLPFTIFTPLPTPHILTSLSFGIGLIGLGVLAAILGVFLTKIIYKLTLKYINWNMDLINRGGTVQ